MIVLLGRSISVVGKTVVFEVVLRLHVFVQLILSVQSASQTSSVDFLGVDAAYGSRTLGFPIFDVALAA